MHWARSDADTGAGDAVPRDGMLRVNPDSADNSQISATDID
ncbi:hypothetical protein I545_5121 [Mycobacterium kansasii 662]|uniref:Uncharacterized protein n=2 Tax=Mycobacterium kansasii TaxID=1768 RepID=A0A1V3XA59_MYCKA|nr:hypothetical protein I547_2842 [Mycobacterium kansasii 824]EUA12540.1 hypothetical protein I545_5121 [Mycobacterium kansasii 662]OOK73186.1 hypothetical protein BZL29_5340 [Mycobacterium kansasii]OOK76008.1 hypothetical protein BZL30_3760 [Mycobacterium kansasii]